MGITFSFRQLLLDSAIVEDLQCAAGMRMPENINSSSYVKELVAMYKGEHRSAMDSSRSSRSLFQGDIRSRWELDRQASRIVDEILNSHKGPRIDREILHEMRRIVFSAE